MPVQKNMLIRSFIARKKELSLWMLFSMLLILVFGKIQASEEPSFSEPTPRSKNTKPLNSSLSIGARPGPYSFLIATGPDRGKQTCYICETGDDPGIIVFTRKLNQPVAKVLSSIDQFISKESKTPDKQVARSWLTVLGEKTVVLDALTTWAKEQGLKKIPVGIFDDADGPPAYKIKPEAELTILLFKQKKVMANFSYRAGEFSDKELSVIGAACKKLIAP